MKRSPTVLELRKEGKLWVTRLRYVKTRKTIWMSYYDTKREAMREANEYAVRVGMKVTLAAKTEESK